MHTSTAFHRSTWLCFGLSTLALGYMVRLHIPGIIYVYILIAALFVASYFLRDQWVLSPKQANRIGIIILLIWLVWFWIDMRRFSSQGVPAFDLMPIMLPRVGPLLSLLLLIKLYLPRKSRDYWLLHLLGLVQIALGCVLDRDAIFGLFLLGYFCTGTWSLFSFHCLRESEAIDSEGSNRNARQPGLAAGVTLAGFWTGLRWVLVAFAIALPLFFMMPRRGQGLLLIEGIHERGFNTEGISLHSRGRARANTDLIMRVEARDPDGQLSQLDARTRWRGLTCTLYREGRWRAYPPYPANDTVKVEIPTYTGLDPDEILLTYYLNVARTRPRSYVFGLGSEYGRDLSVPIGPPLFLAEPMSLQSGFPRVFFRDGRISSLIFRQRETSLHSETTFRTGRIQYQQVMEAIGPIESEWGQVVDWWPTENEVTGNYVGLALAGSAANLSGAFAAALNGRVSTAANYLLIQDWRGIPAYKCNTQIRYYMQELLRVPARLQESFSGKAIEILQLADAAHKGAEARARALERHFSYSEEYFYSLDSVRDDRRLDPTEEFIFNTKQGHCQKFASGLALLLRSQGIPARVVTGYFGSEWNEYGRFHDIRGYHAHAWVEALVDRTDPRTGNVHKQWLTLDPSPPDSIDMLQASVPQPWFTAEREFLRFMWEFFVLDYGEQQWEEISEDLPEIGWMPGTETFTTLGVSAQSNELAVVWPIFVIATSGVVVWVLYYWWYLQPARRRAARTEFALYATVQRILRRLGLRPSRGQTPKEFARRAEAVLQAGSVTLPYAHVPGAVVAAYYDTRFGRRSLTTGREGALKQELVQLARAVRQLPRRGRSKLGLEKKGE